MNKLPIGIFDSGLGGLTVMQAIREQLPEEDLIYVADNKYLPYGGKDKDQIIKRSMQITKFLAATPVKALVVACNTATAAAVKELRTYFDIPIIGVEPGIKPACLITQSGQVGVLATQGTLSSEKYENLRNLHGKDVDVHEEACIGLVEAIEKEYPDFKDAKQILAEHLASLTEERVDTIVLGCTHYPLIEKLIHTMLPNIVTINTGPAIAKQLKRRLVKNSLENSGNFSPKYQFLASDANNELRAKAERILNEESINLLQLPNWAT